MSLPAKISRACRVLLSPFLGRRAGFYQLWILDLGPHPRKVAEVLADDWEVSETDDMSKVLAPLPVNIQSMERGSDTFSWLCITASKFVRAGAKVEITAAMRPDGTYEESYRLPG